MIEGSGETVNIHRGGSSIIASAKFSDWQAALWRIQAGDKSAVVLIDYVQLYVAERSEFFSTISRFLLSFCDIMTYNIPLVKVIVKWHVILEAFGTVRVVQYISVRVSVVQQRRAARAPASDDTWRT